jgi:hypothetical protein
VSWGTPQGGVISPLLSPGYEGRRVRDGNDYLLRAQHKRWGRAMRLCYKSLEIYDVGKTTSLDPATVGAPHPGVWRLWFSELQLSLELSHAPHPR